MNAEWRQQGFAFVDGYEVEPWLRLVSRVKAGTRRLSEHPHFAQAFATSRLDSLASSILGAPASLARAILFDKSSDSNWLVPWHQDLSLAVAARVDLPGYGPWSLKEGIHHVQPPRRVLEQMLALRLHLDDCGPEQGPLRVIPQSHRLGILNEQQIFQLVRDQDPFPCHCQSGQVLAMSPLLLHASSKAAHPSHRRVVHLEFCSASLPAGLAPYAAREIQTCSASEVGEGQPETGYPDDDCQKFISASEGQH